MSGVGYKIRRMSKDKFLVMFSRNHDKPDESVVDLIIQRLIDERKPDHEQWECVSMHVFCTDPAVYQLLIKISSYLKKNIFNSLKEIHLFCLEMNAIENEHMYVYDTEGKGSESLLDLNIFPQMIEYVKSEEQYADVMNGYVEDESLSKFKRLSDLVLGELFGMAKRVEDEKRKI